MLNNFTEVSEDCSRHSMQRQQVTAIVLGVETKDTNLMREDFVGDKRRVARSEHEAKK